MSGLPSQELILLQEWFAREVSKPLSSGDSLISAKADADSQAQSLIHSRNGMAGAERLALYNRQYWFRLIDCMHEDYPVSAALMGFASFNAWVVRYLEFQGSDSPYLADLDKNFPGYMEERYNDVEGENRGQILEAIRRDKAFDKAFDAPEGDPLTLEGIDTAWLTLAPHATPMWLHHDFAEFRRRNSADPEFTKPSPKEHGVLIYRFGNIVYEKEISRAAYSLLKNLETPRTLAELFDAAQLRGEDLAEAEQTLAAWFRDWVELGWLCRHPAPQ